MKIEEPKTPYSYHGEGDSGDEGEASNLDEQLLVSKYKIKNFLKEI